MGLWTPLLVSSLQYRFLSYRRKESPNYMSGRATGPRWDVAKRVHARECNDATYTFQESDQEQAHSYGLLPTGLISYGGYVKDTLSELIFCRAAVETNYEPDTSTP